MRHAPKFRSRAYISVAVWHDVENTNGWRRGVQVYHKNMFYTTQVLVTHTSYLCNSSRLHLLFTLTLCSSA
jgi:hypothetical protein